MVARTIVVKVHLRELAGIREGLLAMVVTVICVGDPGRNFNIGNDSWLHR